MGCCVIKSVNNDFEEVEEKMTVGQRVFELLKQKGMTQKEFSEKPELRQRRSVTGERRIQIRVRTRYN